MIGRLRGTIVEKQPPQLLLDVNGVGYEVEATMTTFYDLPALGAEFTIYTHLVVRDDAHLLFGFASERERSLFRSLIRISGVGAKLALTILSGMSVEDFGRCVRDNDSATLTRLPGVGKKTAERLIIEMRDRIGQQELASAASFGTMASAGADPVEDAVSALTALGYKPQEASRMVRGIALEGLNSEEIIRSALQAAVK